jgi:hypothetical protein
MTTNEKTLTTVLAAIGLIGIGVAIGEAKQEKSTLRLLEKERRHEPPRGPHPGPFGPHPAPFGCPLPPNHQQYGDPFGPHSPFDKADKFAEDLKKKPFRSFDDVRTDK